MWVLVLLAFAIGLVTPPVASATDVCSRRFSRDVLAFGDDNLCYAFVFTKRMKSSYNDAQKFCEKYGGTLVLVKTQQLNGGLAHVLRVRLKSASRFWIGLFAAGRDNQYKWMDGSVMEFNKLTRVLKYDGDNKCVAMDAKGKWYKYRCTAQFSSGGIPPGTFDEKENFICQYPPRHQRPKTTNTPEVIAGPKTTECPVFTCNIDCGLDSYIVNPITRCLECKCDN